MSHKISVTDEVYLRLQRLQGPRESYSEVIARSLNTFELILGIRDGLPASHYLQERPKQEVK